MGLLGLELQCRSMLVTCENIGGLLESMEVQKGNSGCTQEGWGKGKLVVISEPVRESELPLAITPAMLFIQMMTVHTTNDRYNEKAHNSET